MFKTSNGIIDLRVDKIGGGQVMVAILAPSSIPIVRGELEPEDIEVNANTTKGGARW